MDIDLLKHNWEAFGREDPLWAVLTEPSRKGGRWDLDEFLATGENEIAAEFDELERLGISVKRGRALDFGCGVGRLTQALANRFDRCDGVDIAQSMIVEAQRVNRHGDDVHYHVNSAADLALFAAESFDFVLSFIALQHMEPQYSRRYIAEFVRVLRPGGIAVFQLPSGRARAPSLASPAGSAPPAASDVDHAPGAGREGSAQEGSIQEPVMEMYGIPSDQVEAMITAVGGRAEHRFDDARGGPDVEGFRYVVRRVSAHVPALPRPSLSALDAALAAVPDRSDRFPPLITRRSGYAGRFELSARRKVARALRFVTWVQSEYDREMLRAVREARATLREQDAELRRLDGELARLKRGSDDVQHGDGR